MGKWGECRTLFLNSMAVKITYFVHGTTTDNEQGRSTGWNHGELSAIGIEQSKKLREQTKDEKFDAVFSSDLKRAYDTAIHAFGGRVPVTVDQRLRECNYGKYNGGDSKIVEPMHEKMIQEKFPEGESYEDVKTRMASFLEFLKQNYDGKSVALVAHKAPQIALDALLKNKTWESAFRDDWRNTKSWQPGWEYEL